MPHSTAAAGVRFGGACVRWRGEGGGRRGGRVWESRHARGTEAEAEAGGERKRQRKRKKSV
eukprot:898701-Rhodomonas_salina.1